MENTNLLWLVLAGALAVLFGWWVWSAAPETAAVLPETPAATETADAPDNGESTNEIIKRQLNQ
jgi:hypothetical protein